MGGPGGRSPPASLKLGIIFIKLALNCAQGCQTNSKNLFTLGCCKTISCPLNINDFFGTLLIIRTQAIEMIYVKKLHFTMLWKQKS